MKTITIAIPTYKRAALMQATLDAMIDEGIHRIPGVEILVRDNNSPDNTYEILVDYKQRYGISISRNARNHGMNDNIGSVLKSCTTDYMVLTSDEDPIRRAGLQQIQNLLQSNSFAFASTVFNIDGKVYRGVVQGVLPIPPQHFHLSSFYISGLVFHTRLAQSCWSEIDPFIFDQRNVYPHTYLCCLMIARYGCYYLPIELAYMLNKSQDSDLGEYWLTAARLAQNDLRHEFFLHMQSAARNEAEAAAYRAMDAVSVYRVQSLV